MSEKDEKFTYHYSAEEQAELRRLREKYAPREESKLDRLRRLDASVTKPGRIAAILVGALGTLLLGVGMSCTMVGAESLFIPGVAVGTLGIAGIAAAYPLYSAVTKKRRDMLAPEILRLTDELMK
ncbi:MAG: hypothetical protein NC084_10005 [Bacteroides sp.]|nr:hypothetical protein [Eubacterium sp.]MCM1419201.1 hypothetical protein [Roseburia sp.]MCM1463032.1 hypothetical protein [Bacteroides sp.]